MDKINDPISEALEELEKHRQRLIGWWEHQAVANSLMAKFKEDVTYVSVGYQLGEVNGILIHIKGKNLKQLQPMFKFLGNHGYLHKGKPDFYKELHRVIWDFGDIKMLVFFNDESKSSCRFVSKGKKEVEDYEFVCPESNGNGGMK